MKERDIWGHSEIRDLPLVRKLKNTFRCFQTQRKYLELCVVSRWTRVHRSDYARCSVYDRPSDAVGLSRRNNLGLGIGLGLGYVPYTIPPLMLNDPTQAPA